MMDIINDDMKRIIFLFRQAFLTSALLFLMTGHLSAQDSLKVLYPKVGDTIDDYEFKDVVNYSTKTLRISDFKGKWLLIDFWGFSCSACLDSYPKMDSLSKVYSNSLGIIMVGATANTSRGKLDVPLITKRTYKRLDAMYKLNVITAFDSVLYKRYDIGNLPHIMVIDPNGKLVAKVQQINSSHIEDLFSGKLPKFQNQYSRNEAFEMRTGLLSQSNHGKLDATAKENLNNELFHSSLTKAKIGGFGSAPNLYILSSRAKYKNNTRTITAKFKYVSIEALYRAAYFGMVSWSGFDTLEDKSMKPIELFSKSVDVRIQNLDEFTDNGDKYDYQLTIPTKAAKPEYLMKCMQADLYRYFGLSAKLEKKQIPVYFFEVSDEKKLEALRINSKMDRPKPKLSDSDAYLNGYFFRKVPLSGFLSAIMTKLWLVEPIIDKINKDFLIDIDFRANMLSKADIMMKLENYGIRIRRGFNQVSVLVIRDREGTKENRAEDLLSFE